MDMDFKWTTRAEKLLVVDFWWRIQQSRCCICGGDMEPYHRDAGQNPNAASIEHLIPKRDNGPDTVGNVRLAHRSCNNKLGAQWAIDEHQKLIASGEAPKPKPKRRNRPEYVFDQRHSQEPATGQPFVALDKQLVSIPRGATLMPIYKGYEKNAKRVKPKPKMTAAETAAWLREKGIRGA